MRRMFQQVIFTSVNRSLCNNNNSNLKIVFKPEKLKFMFGTRERVKGKKALLHEKNQENTCSQKGNLLYYKHENNF